jgi:hypothetical protein
MIGYKTCLEWMTAAADRGLNLEVRSTGVWENGDLVLSVNSIAGDVAQVPLNIYARVRGDLFLKQWDEKKALTPTVPVDTSDPHAADTCSHGSAVRVDDLSRAIFLGDEA